MHHQNLYGQLPSWKAAPASDRVRSIYGMWSPESFVMRTGRNVMHMRGHRPELVYCGDCDKFTDYVHERGLMVVKDQEVLIARMRRGQSEQRWIWRGSHDKVLPTSDGAIVEKDGRIFLATPYGRPYLLHSGPFDGWGPHPQGVVIRSEGVLSLATKDGTRALMEESDLDLELTSAGDEAWIPHRDGIIYMKGRQLLLAKTRMYHELIHDFTPAVKRWVAQEGPAIDPFMKFNPGERQNAELHRQLRLSGCSWGFHPDGCLVQYEDNLDLITSDGNRVNLFNGTWDGWAAHPYGIAIRKGDEMKLYDGERPPLNLMKLPERVTFGATPFSGIVVAGNGDARIIF